MLILFALLLPQPALTPPPLAASCLRPSESAAPQQKQDPEWPIGRTWEITSNRGETVSQVVRRLSFPNSKPHLLWVISNGPRAQVGISGVKNDPGQTDEMKGNEGAGAPNDPPAGQAASNLLWAQGIVDWSEGSPDSALFLAFTPAQENASVWVSVEPTFPGKITLQIGNLAAALKSVKSRWISYQNPPPPSVLRALMTSATQNLTRVDPGEIGKGNINPDQAAPNATTPQWLPDLLSLLQPNRLTGEIRPDAVRWLRELQEYPCAQDPKIGFQIHNTLSLIYLEEQKDAGALYHARLAAEAAHALNNRKGLNQSLQNVTFLVEKTGDLKLIHEILQGLNASGIVDPASSYLLAEAQWELGLLESAQINLRAQQKTLVPDLKLDRHFRVHQFLGKVEIGLLSWKSARWHLTEAIKAGKQFLRITPETSPAHHKVKEELAGALVRLSIVLDRVNEFPESERLFADAHFTLPHNNHSLSQALYLETSCRYALQRAKVSRAKSAMEQAEAAFVQLTSTASGWRGKVELKQRYSGLAGLSQDLAYLSAPGGRGRDAWAGFRAANRWKALSQTFANSISDVSAETAPNASATPIDDADASSIQDWNPTDLVRSLQPGVSLIEFAVGNHNLYAYQVCNQGVTLYSLASFSQVQDQVGQFLANNQLSEYPGGLNAYLADSYSIYNKLLAPVIQNGDKKLIICTIPELAALPFSALSDQPSQGSKNLSSLEDASIVGKSYDLHLSTSAYSWKDN